MKNHRLTVRLKTRGFAAVAVTVAAAVSAGTFVAAPAGAAVKEPTYRVELTSFTSFEETNEVGSDEIYATFDSTPDVGATQSGRTNVVDNVDRYETHSWDPARSVIWGSANTGRSVGASGFNSVVTLWEHDNSDVDKIAGKVHSALRAVNGLLGDIPILSWITKALSWVSGAVASIIGRNHDDLINKTVVHYDKVSLSAHLTKPGQSFKDVRILKGDGGKYAVWLKVTRVS